MLMMDYLDSRRGNLLDIGMTRLQREMPFLSRDELEPHLSAFVDDVLAALRQPLRSGPGLAPIVADTGSRLGEATARQGIRPSILVRHLGALSDAVGELASREGFIFAADEYHVLNLCIDNAAAIAIEAYETYVAAERAQHDGFHAHELRNAISTARLSYDLLRRGEVGMNSRTSDILSRSLARLESLVERTLFLARLNGAAAEREVVNVRRIVCDLVGDTVAPRGIQIRVEADDESFEVDASVMTSAVGNLLHNAIKFTRDGGEILVRAQRIDEWIEISVEDECGGLSPDIEARVFEPFVRGQDRHGSGLGLAIVREAAQSHHGDVAVENLPGLGCRFVLRVPAATGARSI
jgi:signal transduction histidine kinase